MMEPIQDDIDPRYAILRERLNKPQRLSATAEEWEALEGLVAERDLERENLREAVFTLNNTILSWRKKCEALEAERDAARDAAATYSDLAAEHKAERDRLQAQVESLREERERRDSAWREENARWIARELEWVAERDRLTQALADLGMERDQAVSYVNNLHKRLESSEAERDRLKAEVKAWEQAELATIRDLTAERDRLIQALQRILTEPRNATVNGIGVAEAIARGALES